MELEKVSGADSGKPKSYVTPDVVVPGDACASRCCSPIRAQPGDRGSHRQPDPRGLVFDGTDDRADFSVWSTAARASAISLALPFPEPMARRARRPMPT